AVRFDRAYDRDAGSQRQYDHAAIHGRQSDERDRSGGPFDHAGILWLADYPNHRSARTKLAIRIRGEPRATVERDRSGGERDAIWLQRPRTANLCHRPARQPDEAGDL